MEQKLAAAPPLPSPELEYLLLEPDVSIPVKQYPDDIGYDLSAYLISSSGRKNNTVIGVGLTASIRTGLALRAPKGYFIAIASRSGLATRSVFVSNAPGIIDPGYTGEIVVLLHNSGYDQFWVAHGDRIAQAVLLPAFTPPLREVKSFPPTDRGLKGFGSTGR